MAETDLAKQDKQPQFITVDNSSFACYFDTAKFNQIQRVANLFAASDLVPTHYRNKPANCALAIQMATRLEMDPMMFIQNSYVVNGKPGIQAVVSIALVNSRGPFTGPIQWRFEGQGKTRQCTAYATHKVTKEVCESTVTWAMVEAEGWSKKAGSKWLTMPDLMFRYRSASFLAKLYCPETILGLPTAEELEDIEAGDKYAPAPPKTGRIEERLKRPVESQVVEIVDPTDFITEAGNGALTPLGEEVEAAEAKTAQEAADLEELNKFSSPPAENGPKTTQAAPESTQAVPTDIPAEERYFCPECDETFPKPAGFKKDLCPKLHKGIIDRWSKTDKK